MLKGSLERQPLLGSYLDRLTAELRDVPVAERARLVERARAWIELETDMQGGAVEREEALGAALARLGEPEALAQRLRSEAPVSPEAPSTGGRLTACRACRKEVSTDALGCPHCGAPFPARQNWRGWGYEWKSETKVLGLPLVHVAFGRDERGRMRVARGIIAIGQFGIGGITIAQFGVGALFGLGQFVVAPLALGQFAFGLAAVGQFGIGLLFGAGQIATGAMAFGQQVFGNWFSRG